MARGKEPNFRVTDLCSRPSSFTRVRTAARWSSREDRTDRPERVPLEDSPRLREATVLFASRSCSLVAAPNRDSPSGMRVGLGGKVLGPGHSHPEWAGSSNGDLFLF